MSASTPPRDPFDAPRLTWVRPVVQRLLPPGMVGTPTERTGTLLVSMIGVGVLCLLGISATQFIQKIWMMGALTSSVAALLCLLLIWFRRGAPLGRVSAIFMAICFVAQSLAAGTSGGIHSFTLPSIALYPLCAFVLLGTRAAVVWTCMTLALITTLYAADLAGVSFPRVDAETVPSQSYLNLLVLLIYGFGLVYWHHTANRLQQEALTAARATADAASEAKSRFLANMSHELRTPMNGIIGLTELTLDRKQVDELDGQSLSTVLRTSRILVRLLDDLLNLSRAESGMVALETVPFAPATLVSEVIELLEPARHSTVTLRAEVAPELGWVLGDPIRLRQVLINLIGNAVKFTTEGSVIASIQRTADTLHFQVEDTGPGISAEMLPKIFAPFVQADASTTRQHGGSGLGLAISNHLVECMGGTLRATSTLGEGSSFQFDLNLHSCASPPSETAEAPLPAEASSPILQVLVAEDNPLNQLVIERQLELLGVEFTLVTDGRQALDHLLRDTFDLVLLDIQMPLLDGREVARQAREGGYTGPILALTASALPEDRASARRAGMSGFLVKPVTLDDLREALSLPASAGLPTPD